MAATAAGNVGSESGSVKSCCDAWKEKYVKTEKRRSALKQSVDILMQQINNFEAENIKLKKELEEERACVNVEREGKLKEVTARESLEKQIVELTSELYSLQCKNSDNVDENVKNEILRASLTEKETEINKLRALVEKERQRANVERKNAEAEKALLKTEKEGRLKELAARESFEKEISSLKSEMYSLQQKSSAVNGVGKVEYMQARVGEMEAEINRLKELVEKEKKKAKSEKKKAESLKKKVSEAQKLVESERIKADEEKKHASVEKKRAEEYKRQLEMVKKEADEMRSKLTLELKRLNETNVKLDKEKQMVLNERKRADFERVKAERLKKLAEENEKKFKEEQRRAEELDRQLEKYRKRIEESQEIRKTSCNELVERCGGPPDKDVNNEAAKLKLLKKKLRFEKKQLKLAKQVAHFEKSRNCFLQQELRCLKLESIGFSQRLEMLDRSFLSNVEDYHPLDKMYLQRENELGKSGCTAIGSSDRFKQTCQQPLPQLPVGDSLHPVSGIDPKLKSLLGGSNRKILQSSAIISSTESLSDGKLVGSQDKGSFSATTSEKVVEEHISTHPRFSCLSAEHEKLRSNVVVAENSVRSPLRVNSTKNVDINNKKRKKILDNSESIDHVHSADKKLHLQIGKESSDICCIYNKGIRKPSESEESLDCYLEDFSNSKHRKMHKKLKISSREEGNRVVALQPSYNDEKTKIGTSLTEVCQNARNHMEISQPFIAEACGSGCHDLSNLEEAAVNFGDIDSVDYMKLLDLDDAIEEDRYRVAMERPLSPSLPEIKFQSFGPPKFDKSKQSLEVLEELPRGVDYCTASCSFGSGSVSPPSKFKSSSGVEPNMSNMFIPESGQANLPCENEFSSGCDRFSHFCVVPLSIKEDGSVSRIIGATKNCMARCHLVSQTEWTVQKIICTLDLEDLSSKEKVCVFLSLVLVNFSIVMSKKSGDAMRTDYTLYSKPFAEHVEAVLSDWNTRDVFTRIFGSGELLTTIEDFLVEGIVFYYGPSSVVSVEDESSVNVLLDCENVAWLPKAASTEQLVAGAVLLAAICLAADCRSFICEASFNICRMSNYDRSLMLTILHVFAYTCGDKLFNTNGCKLVTRLLRIIVTQLERNGALVAPGAASPMTIVPSKFSCVKCPFSVDDDSMDDVISLLLENIKHSILGTLQEDSTGAAEMLRNRQNLFYTDCVLMQCTSDMLATQLDSAAFIPSIHSDSAANEDMCYFINLLSLLELVTHNMSWEWVSTKVIPQLLYLLESCLVENFAAALVIFLGHLGRLGVTACGYGDAGVKHLQEKLCAILNRDKGVRLPVQLVVVNALLELLPLKFEELMEGDGKLLPNTSAGLIRVWFSSLGKHQQELLLPLLKLG